MTPRGPHAAARRQAGLTNIRVAQVNAPELFKVTAAGTVAEVWTFFPDPWPKKKHHKRRIVQKAMAGDIHRALAPDGVWRIATDIEDYALHVHEVMDGLDGWKNLGSVTVSLPLEHVGKGNADMAADMPARRLHRIRAIRGPRAHQLREEGPGRRPRDPRLHLSGRYPELIATRRNAVDLHNRTTSRKVIRVVRPHRLTVRTPDFQSDNESSTLSGGYFTKDLGHSDRGLFVFAGPGLKASARLICAHGFISARVRARHKDYPTVDDVTSSTL